MSPDDAMASFDVGIASGTHNNILTTFKTASVSAANNAFDYLSFFNSSFPKLSLVR